jgi:RNA polymerase sigma factor (sigma-70 family)
MEVPLSRSSDDALAAFLSVRSRLFGIACRILHNPSEAEEIVQDVWVRWQTADRSAIRDTAAFLVATATRLAINVLQSARSRRETTVESWVPEPVDRRADPRPGAERLQALESGARLLLQRLTPTERAAYVLREAFDYSYREVADVLHLEEGNARQVVTRARKHVADDRGAPAGSSEPRRLLEAFLATSESGDMAMIEGFFASSARRQVATRPAARSVTLEA